MKESPIYTHMVREYTPDGAPLREHLCTSFSQAKVYTSSMNFCEIEEIEAKKRW